MVPHSTVASPPPSLFFFPSPPLFPLLKPRLPRRAHFPAIAASISNSFFKQDPPKQQPPQPPRTLFPGGYKRPEIRVPTLLLHLTPEDVLDNGHAVDLVDEAVSGRVGIVVLSGGEGTGKSLYEAACVVKSVVRDRAYFLIAERVDVASAVNASGVLLSDQGLPAIVARTMMTSSKSEAVFLPLVGRRVQTTDKISTLEGVDFLICSITKEDNVNDFVKSVFEDLKIPIFVSLPSIGSLDLHSEASRVMRSGVSGFAISLKDISLFNGGILSRLFDTASSLSNEASNGIASSSDFTLFKKKEDFSAEIRVAGFVKLEDQKKQLIETERSVLTQAINVIREAAPMMEEVSLLVDAVSQIDEPFLLVIVGEYNSGKSTFINALLGERYLKDGVVPTTNEITFLRYAELASDEMQRCERHPDGQLICYIPAPILKEMTIVDTPGTNVILQRQQRLTEEFVPRADLLLFVISADRPLTESEVAFLRYTQQWKKKVVFVLNKSDIYRNHHELEEATSFIKENTRKLLNVEHVTLYPVSSRHALKAKLSNSYVVQREDEDLSTSDVHLRTARFQELEEFLYSFLDGSTVTGMERVRLKLETPAAIGEQLIASCGSLLRRDCRAAERDLASVQEIIDDVKDYAIRMEGESVSWRRKILSQIATAKSRVMELIESTLQLSNLNVVAAYVFKGEKSAQIAVTSKVQNDIISPALLDARRLLVDYLVWLQSSNTKQARLYRESFDARWPSLVYPANEMLSGRLEVLRGESELSLNVVEKFSVSTSSKLFEKEVKEVFLGTFGGLGAAGLSASLLTSVLQTTLEDLLALGLCSAGGLLAISSFPGKRQAVINKVNKAVDAFACEVDEAMQKDLSETVENMEKFINIISRPYQEAAQQRLDRILEMQKQLSQVEDQLRSLQLEIQNMHVS